MLQQFTSGTEHRFMRPNGTTKASYPLHTQKMANTSFQVQVTRQLASGMRIPEYIFLGHFEGTPVQSFLLHFVGHGNEGLGSDDAHTVTWDVETSVFASGSHKGESHTIHSVVFALSMANMWLPAPMTGDFASGMWIPEHLLVSQLEYTPIASRLLHSRMMAGTSSPVHTTEQFASGMRRLAQLFLGLSEVIPLRCHPSHYRWTAHMSFRIS